MRFVAFGAIALLWIGCGNGAEENGGMDLSVPNDLAIAPADASMIGGHTDFGFGTDTDGGLACMATGTAHAQYVWNAVTLPQSRTDFGFDLNGDGRTDNQYGNIVGALTGQGLGVQATATMAIDSGRNIMLVDERSSDAAFTSDSCAATTMYVGQSTASPDFSGSGHFTIDASATVGHFAGPIAAARFTSEPPPATAQIPSTVQVDLSLFGPTPVTLIGARVTYLRAANGTVTGGQLNGAIRRYDIDHQLVPNMAAGLNAQAHVMPPTSQSMQILSIFDNGGIADPACSMGTCKNLDGSCAVANDGNITDCEVGTNSLVRNLLAPDVQMFDAAGNYHPSAANANKDSLSIGLGFTAVGATF